MTVGTAEIASTQSGHADHILDIALGGLRAGTYRSG
jgi:hypothetical protein